MMALQWMDRKPVTILSTCHDDVEMKNTGKINGKTNMPVIKPNVVIDYNTSMNAVDKHYMFQTVLGCITPQKLINKHFRDQPNITAQQGYVLKSVKINLHEYNISVQNCHFRLKKLVFLGAFCVRKTDVRRG
jgi:hypothetical protein